LVGDLNEAQFHVCFVVLWVGAGVQLEGAMGSVAFALLSGGLLLLTHALMVAVAFGLWTVFGYANSINTCAVGIR
jgi:hypothetical protein